MKDLEHNIKDFYLHKALSDSALQRILQGENGHAEGTDQVSPIDGSNKKVFGNRWIKRYNSLGFIALVASLLLVFSVLLYFPTKKIEELVYTEVAMNHNKQLDVEFNGDDYRTLAQAMTKLDFPLNAPQKIGDKYSLIGGRYCSIQGALAAQLKVKNNLTGDIDTLYVTPLTDNLNKIAAQKFTFNGIDIELWQTDKLFYALASNRSY